MSDPAIAKFGSNPHVGMRWELAMTGTNLKAGRRRLPDRRAIQAGGLTFTATASRFDDGSLGEVFLANHEANLKMSEHDAYEDRLRRLAKYHGYRIRKTPRRKFPHLGGYMLLDNCGLGSWYDATLEEVESYLKAAD